MGAHGLGAALVAVTGCAYPQATFVDAGADSALEASSVDSRLDTPSSEVESGGGCDAGFSACSGGCVDLGNDPVNCGICARACESTKICAAGYCCRPSGGTCGFTTDCCAGHTCTAGKCS